MARNCKILKQNWNFNPQKKSNKYVAWANVRKNGANKMPNCQIVHIFIQNLLMCPFIGSQEYISTAKIVVLCVRTVYLASKTYGSKFELS